MAPHKGLLLQPDLQPSPPTGYRQPGAGVRAPAGLGQQLGPVGQPRAGLAVPSGQAEATHDAAQTPALGLSCLPCQGHGLCL